MSDRYGGPRRTRARRRMATLVATTLVGVLIPVVATTAAAPAAQGATNLTRYVNPFLGTTDEGQSYPGATQPFGMVQWSPDTTNDIAHLYDYRHTEIRGFSLAHHTGYGPRTVSFVPYAGNVDPERSPGSDPAHYYSQFSHSNESASPGHYRVKTDSNIDVELTATKRAGMGTFTYPTGPTATLMINLGDNEETGWEFHPNTNSVSIDPENSRITGHAGRPQYKMYFVAQFDRPFSSHGTFNGDTVTPNGTSTPIATRVGSYITFDTSSGATIGVRVGVSYVSAANAQANLDAEIAADATFDTVKAGAAQTWNETLNRFAVEDPAALDDDLVQYYTHLYFFLTQPNTVSDVNGEYWGADNVKHTAPPGRAQYSTISHWDHGRSFFPLLALLYPSVASDTMRSLLDASRQLPDRYIPGFMMRFLDNGARDVFGGSDFALAAQAYAFGARDFDAAGALDELMTASTVPGKGRWNLEPWVEKGFAPVGDCCTSYETTLQWALTDFAASQLATALGNTEQAQMLAARGGNWRNTFDVTATDNGFTGYAWGRREDGTFEPWTSSTDGTGSSTKNVGTETCSAQLSFLVPQDINGLMEAMGGREEFVRRLDHFTSQFSIIHSNFNDEETERSCQYLTPANEPDLQVPWMYNWAGEPAKAQSVARRILTQVYTNTPGGIPGNNDWGALSAYYLQAAMGLYPEVQGVGGFAVSSPLFAKITLRLEGDKTLTITADNASRANQYIQSATLNGADYDSPWIPIEALVNDDSENTLSFTLGATATSWGANPTVNPPPSFPSPGTAPTAAQGRRR